MENAPIHSCPYCGRTLARPTEAEPTPTTLTGRLKLARPVYVETRARDINIGLALGLAVVLFMDVGVFVRRDFTALGFSTSTNVLVAASLTALLALWYWRMRVDTAATNAEQYTAYEKRLETWNHTYYCPHCDAFFVRE